MWTADSWPPSDPIDRETRSAGRVAAPDAEPPVVLSLDIGSSSVRAALFDGRGRQVGDCRHQAGLDGARRTYGGESLDPYAVMERCFACLDVVHGRIAALGLPVSAVAISTLAGNLLGLDGEGIPVTPVHTYANTAAGGGVRRLKQALDEAEVHQRTGCPFHSGYWPAILLWLTETRPDQYRRVRTWATLGQFLVRIPLGRPVPVSFSVASWSGMLDRHRMAWDAELVEHLNLRPESLPPLAGALPGIGLTDACARRWPGLKAAAWYPAVADGAAANVGTGCLGPDRIALTIGTTSAVRIVLPGTPMTVPPGLWTYRVDETRVLTGGALNEGGNLHARIRELFGLRGPAGLEDRPADRRPDGHGLIVLPTFLGERSPGWRSGLRGGVYGLSAATTPADLLQAGMEAVAYRLAAIISRLEGPTAEKSLVVACGGALRESPAWRRMIADVLGRPVALFQGAEASLRGAALLALESMGALPDAASAPDLTGEPVLPDPSAHEVYRKARVRHEAFYRKMVAFQEELEDPGDLPP